MLDFDYFLVNDMLYPIWYIGLDMCMCMIFDSMFTNWIINKLILCLISLLCTQSSLPNIAYLQATGRHGTTIQSLPLNFDSNPPFFLKGTIFCQRVTILASKASIFVSKASIFWLWVNRFIYKILRNFWIISLIEF